MNFFFRMGRNATGKVAADISKNRGTVPYLNDQTRLRLARFVSEDDVTTILQTPVTTGPMTEPAKPEYLKLQNYKYLRKE